MRIEFENIVLRDMIESDIEDYVRWFTVEREPTHIVLNVGLDHIPKDDIFKFNSHNELL